VAGTGAARRRKAPKRAPTKAGAGKKTARKARVAPKSAAKARKPLRRPPRKAAPNRVAVSPVLDRERRRLPDQERLDAAAARADDRTWPDAYAHEPATPLFDEGTDLDDSPNQTVTPAPEPAPEHEEPSDQVRARWEAEPDDAETSAVDPDDLDDLDEAEPDRED
jgi:hypothetical protein